MESWRLHTQKARFQAVSTPNLVGKSEEMAPSAAALAATAALLSAAFPGCSTSYHVTQTACARARIGGKIVCVRAGERCSPRYERRYRAYGLTCRKGVLREHNYIGPATP